MLNFEEAKAKRDAKLAAKKRIADDHAMRAEEIIYGQEERILNQPETERILREVAQVGGWDVWEALEKQREQSLYEDAPPYEGPSLEQMLEDYEPEPPEDDEPEETRLRTEPGLEYDFF